MNAERLRLTLDRRLWDMFLETARVLADIFESDADVFNGKTVDKSGNGTTSGTSVRKSAYKCLLTKDQNRNVNSLIYR
jgi:hypothetical protein